MNIRFAGIGLCELDDVVSNSLGALMGYAVAEVFLMSDGGGCLVESLKKVGGK